MKPPSPIAGSLRIKFALWAALLSGGAVLGFVAASSFIVYDNMLEDADFQLTQTGREVCHAAANGEFAPMLYAGPRATSISAEPAQLYLVELRDPAGVAVFTQPGWELPPWVDPLRADRPTFDYADHGGARWRTIRIRIHSGYAARLAIEVTEIETEVWRMVETYLRTLPLALLIIAAGGWWIAGRVAKPIEGMAAAAERITAGDLSERMPPLARRDELGRLTAVLNRMMARLEASYQQASRFSSDASHELRTPLTIMQGKIESALQGEHSAEDLEGVLAELQEQIQVLKGVLESLLLFSRSDAGRLVIERRPIDVSLLAELLAEDFELEMEGGTVEVAQQIEPGLRAEGESRLLGIALKNLLRNAAKYNLPEGGRIEILALRRRDGIEIRIENTGPEIPADERGKIFDRFYRAAGQPKRGGFGIGLSLARLIAEAHGGTLTLARSGGGINAFALRLPEPEPEAETNAGAETNEKAGAKA